MPRKKKMQSKRKRSSRGELSPQSLVYRGPLRLSQVREQDHLSTQELTYYVSIASSGAGVISNVIGNVNSSSLEWTNFATIYDEYRVLSTLMIYEPAQNDTYVSTFLGAPIVFCWDRDSSNALSGYAAGFNYESSIVSNVGKRKTLSLKMSGAEDAGYTTTSAPVATWWLKMYAANLTNGTIYGGMFIRYLIQFRARV